MRFHSALILSVFALLSAVAHSRDTAYEYDADLYSDNYTELAPEHFRRANAAGGGGHHAGGGGHAHPAHTPGGKLVAGTGIMSRPVGHPSEPPHGHGRPTKARETIPPGAFGGIPGTAREGTRGDKGHQLHGLLHVNTAPGILLTNTHTPTPSA